MESAGFCRGLDRKAVEVMSTPTIVARMNDTLEDAARLMYESGVGSIVVVDDDGRLAGILTRRDVLYLVAKGEAKRNPRLSTIMSTSVITGSPDEALSSILHKMRDAGVKHVVIVDDKEKPVGIVSMWDILMSIARECLSESQ